ncbi:MAG: zinc ribbon domain-containing protein [Methanocorpusculum parvum]|nr:zinc ribbon domain-containing protein [Methanocorpusculum parvum]
MGFFDDLKATAKSEMDGVKKNVKEAQLKSELNDLKREETEIYAEIGRQAVSEAGVQKFGDAGAKLLEVQEKIAAKEAEISDVKGPEAELVCPSCKTPYTEGTKFCSNCGAKLGE